MIFISGGQTGADQAGLYAAYDKGLRTGGYAPARFMTLTGTNYILRDKFSLIQSQGGYKYRTWLNVEISDCTIRFAHDFNSAGEICTLNAIQHYFKPYIDVYLQYPITNGKIKEIGNWIIKNKFEIINIAGNSQKEYDVYTPVYDAICELIDYLREKEYIK
jgi:hypothetical protein